MDKAEYGVFVIATDLMLWINLLDIGTSGGLGLTISKYRGFASPEQNVAVSTAHAMQQWVGLAIAMVGCLLSVVFPWLFALPSDLSNRAITTFAFLSLATGISNAGRVYTTLLLSNRFGHIDNLVKLAGIIVRLLTIVLGLKLNLGVLSLAWATLTVAIGTHISLKHLCHRHLPHIEIRKSLSAAGVRNDINKIGAWFAVNTIANTCLRTLDRIIAARALGLTQLTVLSITNRIYDLCQGNLATIPNNSWPLIAEKASQASTSPAYNLWRQISSFTNTTSAILIGTVWAANRAFIGLWTGDSLYAGNTVDTIIAATALAVTMGYSLRAALTATGNIRQQAVLKVFEATTLACLAVPLCAKHGIAGMSLAKLGGTLGLSFIPLNYLTAQAFQIPVPRFIAEQSTMLLRILLTVTPVCMITRILITAETSILTLALKALLCCAVCAVLAWRTCLNSTERAAAMKLLRRKAATQGPP